MLLCSLPVLTRPAASTNWLRYMQRGSGHAADAQLFLHWSCYFPKQSNVGVFAGCMAPAILHAVCGAPCQCQLTLMCKSSPLKLLNHSSRLCSLRKSLSVMRKG